MKVQTIALLSIVGFAAVASLSSLSYENSSPKGWNASQSTSKTQAEARQTRIEEKLKAAEIRVAKEKAKKLSASKIVKVDYSKQQAELLAKTEANGEWSYRTYTDEATGKEAKTGSLTSKNSMNFDFPYRGIQHGHFTVRNHPRYGVSAYLSIRKGQLLCSSYSNPTVLIRFDNGAASSYNCNKPADYSSNTVFIEGVGRLEARMKTAKKMYVTVSVYNEGSRTWEFNVNGYNKSEV